MIDERDEAMWHRIGESYNVPPEAPTEAMWTAIAARLPGESADGTDGVVDLAAARRTRQERHSALVSHRVAGWAVAAAALLVLGVGIGRMTAPGGTDQAAPTMASAPSDAASATSSRSDASLTMAARDHFGRTESLLTMVRADARTGRMDPSTRAWAEGLLAQTRLLLDAQTGDAPAVNDLLLDLELVLVQIVGVSETGSIDESRARTELALALRSLDEGEVLPRIQAALPPGLSGI